MTGEQSYPKAQLPRCSCVHMHRLTSPIQIALSQNTDDTIENHVEYMKLCLNK